MVVDTDDNDDDTAAVVLLLVGISKPVGSDNRCCTWSLCNPSIALTLARWTVALTPLMVEVLIATAAAAVAAVAVAAAVAVVAVVVVSLSRGFDMRL